MTIADTIQIGLGQKNPFIWGSALETLEPYRGIIRQSCLLLGGDAAAQRAPQPIFHATAYPDNKAFQHADARQQDLVREQPRRGTIEEHAGPLGTGPAQGTKPACEAKTGHGITKVTVTKARGDFCGVLSAPSALTVLADYHRNW
jgi:hypothetical protein